MIGNTRINMIAAIGLDNGIGKDGKLLWKIKEDLRAFKVFTKNHPCIMGRKTWESLPGPLVGRECRVVTRQQDYQAEGAVVFHTPEEAIKAGSETGEIFIIGGAELYEYFLHCADALYITHVSSIAAADTFFPDFISLKKWSPIFTVHVSDEPKATLIKYQMDFSWFTANINKG